MTTNINLPTNTPIEKSDRSLLDVQNDLGTGHSIADDAKVPEIPTNDNNIELNSKPESKSKKSTLTPKSAKDRIDTRKSLQFVIFLVKHC
jgi:hypothetical protein